MWVGVEELDGWILLFTPKELSFLRRFCLWWHFLRISSVFEENFNWVSKMVPRYLYSSLCR